MQLCALGISPQTPTDVRTREVTKKILENCIYSLWFIYDPESENIIHLAVMTLQGFSSSNIAQAPHTHSHTHAHQTLHSVSICCYEHFHLATRIDSNESVNVKNIIQWTIHNYQRLWCALTRTSSRFFVVEHKNSSPTQNLEWTEQQHKNKKQKTKWYLRSLFQMHGCVSMCLFECVLVYIVPW